MVTSVTSPSPVTRPAVSRMYASGTWAIMPGMSRLLRGWLYGNPGDTPVAVPAVARPPWQ